MPLNSTGEPVNITRADEDPNICCHMTSKGNNELTALNWTENKKFLLSAYKQGQVLLECDIQLI